MEIVWESYSTWAFGFRGPPTFSGIAWSPVPRRPVWLMDTLRSPRPLAGHNPWPGRPGSFFNCLDLLHRPEHTAAGSKGGPCTDTFAPVGNTTERPVSSKTGHADAFVDTGR